MASGEAFGGLKEWALRYVKHRDISVKKITAVKDTDYGFRVANSDGTSTDCIIQPSLKGLSSRFVSAAVGNTLVVTLSNDENIRAVYSMWDALAANQGLLIVFVSPFSGQEDKWVLRPYLHNKVCDRSSLLQGLRAMAELVEPVDAETLAVRVREQGF
ncbi:hypothetical protein HYU40_04865 [Candidatus Woesearchaeota archaeon]|nr:hypothetical protein [Candidatus Woesearchaeota archaeon]